MNPISKILILGNAATGKSTLAKLLGDLLDMPVFHLDVHMMTLNGKQKSKTERYECVRQMLSNEKWIIESNWIDILDLRIDAADTVVFIEQSKLVCLWRVLKRYLLRTGPSSAIIGCKYGISLSFIKLILIDFDRKLKPYIFRRIGEHSEHLNIFIIKSTIQDFQWLCTNII